MGAQARCPVAGRRQFRLLHPEFRATRSGVCESPRCLAPALTLYRRLHPLVNPTPVEAREGICYPGFKQYRLLQNLARATRWEVRESRRCPPLALASYRHPHPLADAPLVEADVEIRYPMRKQYRRLHQLTGADEPLEMAAQLHCLAVINRCCPLLHPPGMRATRRQPLQWQRTPTRFHRRRGWTNRVCRRRSSFPCASLGWR